LNARDAIVTLKNYSKQATLTHLPPQIYLKREHLPPDPRYRLDNLLQHKAQQGVKVYVLLFAEASTVISLGSAFVKATLEELDDNIKVLCHGPPVANMLFSHHQKTVVVGDASLILQFL
jgi:phospholipase D1/2